MQMTAEWRLTKKLSPVQTLSAVERGNELGYGRLGSHPREKLASDLAQIIDAPVPVVSIEQINGEVFTISRVANQKSYPLLEKGQQRDYTGSELAALRAASGLICFLLWVGAEDQSDDTNLVVNSTASGLEICAIDFEHAFGQFLRDDYFGAASEPPALKLNPDPKLIEAALIKIENVPMRDIRRSCCASGHTKEESLRIAQKLIVRKSMLRDYLVKQGWIE